MVQAATRSAAPVEGALVPEVETHIDGVWWLYFSNDGTFAGYEAMPNAVRFGCRTYIKAGWNSDTCRVTYKQGRYAEPVSIMAPLKR